MSFGSCIEWVSYSNTDTNKMVWKAITYSKLGEYAPHLNYHHRNGGREVRLVQLVTSSGHSMHSSEQTCNGRIGWQLVYHMNALSCMAPLRAAPSATNQICQTPPWSPANQYSVLWIEWHWCCINCRCLLRYIAGLVVPATSNGHNTFRISGTTNAITKPHIPQDPNPQTHLCVNLKFHKYFILYLYDTINHRNMVWIHLI